MGQKVNPISLRLQHTNRTFDSCWFSRSFYQDLLSRDLKADRYLSGILKQLQLDQGRFFFTHLPKTSKGYLFFHNPMYTRPYRSKRFQIRFRPNFAKASKRQRISPFQLRHQITDLHRTNFYQPILSFINKTPFLENIKRHPLNHRIPNILTGLPFQFFKNKSSLIQKMSYPSSKYTTNKSSINYGNNNPVMGLYYFLSLANLLVTNIRFVSNSSNFIKPSNTVSLIPNNSEICSQLLLQDNKRFSKTMLSKLSIINGEPSRKTDWRWRRGMDTKLETGNPLNSTKSIDKTTVVPNLHLISKQDKPSMLTKHSENNSLSTQVKVPWLISLPPEFTYIENKLSLGIGVPVSIQTFQSANDTQSALFLAQEIVYYLERRIPFRRIQAQILKEITKTSYIKGVRISCSGRMGGRSKKAQQARTETVKWGETSLHVFSAKIDFASKSALTPFGLIGVKVWVSYS